MFQSLKKAKVDVKLLTLWIYIYDILCRLQDYRTDRMGKHSSPDLHTVTQNGQRSLWLRTAKLSSDAKRPWQF